MPEGDSLVRLAHRLRPVVHEQVLVSSDFRTPKLATADLAGWQVVNVTAKAKYLCITLTSPADQQSGENPLVIVSHLGMEGAWQVDVRVTHQTRCVLQFQQHRLVGSNLATLELLTSSQAQQYLAFLGPDVLATAWDEPAATAELLALGLANFRQAADQPVATALLDQRIISGLGNIYRCEVLLLARMNPYRNISTLTDTEITGLITLGRGLMLLNVPPRSAGRTTRSTVEVRPDDHAPFGIRIATEQEQARAQADRRRQRNKPAVHWVYGRRRQGCLRCDGPVRVDAIGTGGDDERLVHWCPHCQRA